MDLSFAKHDEQGSEVAARTFYQREVSAVRDTADRTLALKFADLGSGGAARRYGNHRCWCRRPDDCEEFLALKQDRRTQSNFGDRSSVVVACFMECRHQIVILRIGEFCFAFEHL